MSHADSVSLQASYGTEGSLENVSFTASGSKELMLSNYMLVLDSLEGGDFLAQVDVEQLAKWLVAFELAVRCSLTEKTSTQVVPSGSPIMATEVSGSSQWIEFLAGVFKDVPLHASSDDDLTKLIKTAALSSERKPLVRINQEEESILPESVTQAMTNGELPTVVLERLSSMIKILGEAKPYARGMTDEERRIQLMGEYVRDSISAFLQVPASSRSDMTFDVDPKTDGVQTAESILLSQLDRMIEFVENFYVQVCSQSALSLRANGDFLQGVLPSKKDTLNLM